MRDKIRICDIKLTSNEGDSQNCIIDESELKRLAGLKAWNKSDGKLGIVKGFSENGQNYIKIDDLNIILIFEIFKYTRKINKNIDLVKEFKEKLKIQTPSDIMSEIIKELAEIESYFWEFQNTYDLDSKYSIIIKIMNLLQRKTSSLSEECITLNDKEYIKKTQNGEVKSLHLIEEYIDSHIIRKYESIFKNTINKFNKDATSYTVISELLNPSSLYNNKKEKYNSKLLRNYKTFFHYLENELSTFEVHGLRTEESFNKVKKEFLNQSKNIFKSNIIKLKEVISAINFKEIYASLDLIKQKKQTLTKPQKSFQEIQDYERNYLSMFMYIDEVLDFYNSKNGKLINDYFKIHSTLKELFYYLSYFIIRSGDYSEENTYSDVDTIRNSFVSEFTPIIKCLGYDYEFEYHLLHDAYDILNDKYLQSEIGVLTEDILEAIEKILPQGSFYINSYYHSRLIKKAIYSNNPKAVKILQGYISDVDEKDLLNTLFDGVKTDKMLTPTINCITDINKKSLYNAIYEGNHKLIDLLYEDKKVKLLNKSNSIENYLCIKGSNSLNTCNIILKHLELNNDYETFIQLKDNFLSNAALWGNSEIVNGHIKYLKNKQETDLNLQKILFHLLSQNLVDIFSQIFFEKDFDSTSFIFNFIKNRNIFWNDINKDTWDFIFSKACPNIDVNKKFKTTYTHYRYENTIAGYAKERIPFSIRNKIFLQILFNNTNIFKGAFESVLRSIENNPDRKTSGYCYIGIPCNEEIHSKILEDINKEKGGDKSE